MIPPVLYKYRKFDENGLRILREREFYFAEPATLNDPFDCQFNVAAALAHSIENEPDAKLRSWLSRLLHYQFVDERQMRRPIHERATELVAKAGILSTSAPESLVKPLMWSHYADEHRGFAIGLDQACLNRWMGNLEQTLIVGADRVVYEATPSYHDFMMIHSAMLEHILMAEPAGFNAALFGFFEQYREELTVKMVRTKSAHWSYEDEVRIVRQTSGALRFEPPDIKEIVFGLRASQDNIDHLRSMLAGKEWVHLVFKRAVAIPSSFEFLIHPID